MGYSGPTVHLVDTAGAELSLLCLSYLPLPCQTKHELTTQVSVGNRQRLDQIALQADSFLHGSTLLMDAQTLNSIQIFNLAH
jgi:hypothetical protein